MSGLKAKVLAVPANATLMRLPPNSPEINPVERVWAFLWGRHLSNRVHRDYDHVSDAAAAEA